MSVPATMLTTGDEDQFTIVVIIDPLPSILGIPERTRVLKLHDHTIIGAVDGFQQVPELLHGDDVRFVVAHVNCEVCQRLMAILGTCCTLLVIFP